MKILSLSAATLLLSGIIIFPVAAIENPESIQSVKLSTTPIDAEERNSSRYFVPRNSTSMWVVAGNTACNPRVTVCEE